MDICNTTPTIVWHVEILTCNEHQQQSIDPLFQQLV